MEEVVRVTGRFCEEEKIPPIWDVESRPLRWNQVVAGIKRQLKAGAIYTFVTPLREEK